MEAAGSRPTDNLDSTARLMGEALAKASTELEKLVTVFCDHLAVFNEQLGFSFQDEARAAEDRMETRLRQTMEALQRDREELLKRLAECKQSEIRTIIDTGKASRGQLAVKVDETAVQFSRTLSEKMAELQALLSGPQAEALSRYETMRAEVDAAGQDLLTFLADKSRDKFDSLSAAAAYIEAEAAQTVTAGISGIEARLQDSLAAMLAESLTLEAEIVATQARVPVELEAAKQISLAALKSEDVTCQEKISVVTAEGNGYALEVSSSFDVSMSELSTLLTTLYDARLKNLLAQSRTEIVNSARQAEERISSSRTDLHSSLKELQRDYAEKFEALYEKFEKTLDEENQSENSQAARVAKDGRAREQLNALFRRLGQEMIDTAATAAGRVEDDFQRSVSAFEKRIESARDTACESLEREFKLMQKELVRTKQDFDKQLAELKTQLVRIEKDGRDAADIVRTIASANLEF